MAMTCSECGAKTLGLIVTKQGGSRTLSIAAPRGRKVYCRSCGGKRVSELNAKDEKTRQANRRQQVGKYI